jgi:pimeloyl-ACP methyl ester carboxylesterase
MHRVKLLLLLGLLSACGGGETATPTRVDDIKSADGTILKASYFSPGKPGPGIVLLHQCNMDRHAWDTLATDLTAAGFHVLAFDRRGFGESASPATSDGARLAADADAAYAHLGSLPDVDRGRISAGGASCGVDEALGLAARHETVRTLVLLSGYAGESQLKQVAATPSLAIFGAVSRYDNAKDMEALVGASRNPASTLKVYPASWLGMVMTSFDHGVSMFDGNPDLRPSIVSWLRQQSP